MKRQAPESDNNDDDLNLFLPARPSAAENPRRPGKSHTSASRSRDYSKFRASLEQTKADVWRKYRVRLDDVDAVEYQVELKFAKKRAETAEFIASFRPEDDHVWYKKTMDKIMKENGPRLRGPIRLYYESLEKCHKDALAEFERKRQNAIVLD